MAQQKPAGRPRKDGSTRPATERLIDAFMELLAEKPLSELTVSTVCRRAGVNRNSFYYHYSDLMDLAEDAIESILDPRVPQMLLTMGTANDAVTDAITADPHWQRRVAKMRALLGPHSTKELTELVRSHVIGFWCDIFGITPEHLNDSERLVLRYVSAGMLDVIGHLEDYSHLGDIRDLLGHAPIVRQGVTAAITALDSARNRQDARNRKPQ